MDLEKTLNIGERFEACIIAGAIGDAWGSSFENQPRHTDSRTFYWHPIEPAPEVWTLTDDTQLTLASCETLIEIRRADPEVLSRYFVKYYRQNRLPGIGASTLKAIRELQEGGHWSQVGRSGEFAMGTDGYVVNSVPFAVFAVSRVMNMGLKEMFKAVIGAGGDTDTNASMAGQIAGALIGLKGIPIALMQQISQVPGFIRLKEIVDRTVAMIN